MKTDNDKQSLSLPHSPLPALAPADLSRRRFIKQSSSLVAASTMAAGLSPALAAGSQSSAPRSPLAANPLGFNGERQDTATGLYHLGNGYRVYHPAMMRFHASDSMSPFGQGRINSYAYSLGDPINLRDPSGHVVLSGILVGMIVGAVMGAAVVGATEGFTAATGRHIDWRNVVIGSAMGLLGAGFGGVTMLATKTSVQIGLVVADIVTPGLQTSGLTLRQGPVISRQGSMRALAP